MALSVAAILAGLEGLLRLLGFEPEIAVEMRPAYEKFERDADLIWSLKKSWSGRELNDAPVTVGRLGLRGPEPNADADTTVLFLGDSVVYGHFLADAETLPFQLQMELRARSKRDAQVINAGVPGFSTFQELALYRKTGRALEPGLVLLGFCLNDVTERYVSVAEYGGPRFFMRSVDTSRGVGRIGGLWLSSAIRIAFTRTARSLEKRIEVYNVGSLWQRAESTEIREAWDVVFEELDDLIAAVHQDGARLAVVLFPYQIQLKNPRASLPQRALVDFFRSKDVAFVDLLPLMEAEPHPRALFMDPNHLSSVGAKRVSRWIAAFLIDRDLLPEPAASRSPAN